MCCFIVVEAINAIVTYSESSMVLLNRKRLSKNILFQYLASEGIMVNVMGLKSHLIENTLEQWEVSRAQNPVAASTAVPPQVCYRDKGPPSILIFICQKGGLWMW